MLTGMCTSAAREPALNVGRGPLPNVLDASVLKCLRLFFSLISS